MGANEIAEAAGPRILRHELPLAPLEHYRRAGSARGVAWTPLRSDVLALMWRTRAILNAYEVVPALAAGAKVYVNSVYRCLKALEDAKLIVRIASQKRHVIAPDPETRGWATLLCSICGDCSLIPARDVHGHLRGLALDHRVIPERQTVECLGRCPACT